jgi:hypothetical protein
MGDSALGGWHDFWMEGIGFSAKARCENKKDFTRK